MGTTIGHLWPLVRLFLHKRALGTKHKIDNTEENIPLNDYREFVNDHFALDINLEESDDIEKVVQTMCYTTRKCIVFEEIENSGVDSAQQTVCVPFLVLRLKIIMKMLSKSDSIVQGVPNTTLYLVQAHGRALTMYWNNMDFARIQTWSCMSTRTCLSIRHSQKQSAQDTTQTQKMNIGYIRETW